MKRIVLSAVAVFAALASFADYDAVPAPFYADVTESGGTEVLIPDAAGRASTGKLKVGRVMDAKVFGQMNEADAKFVRCAAEVTLAITGGTMRVTFDCPVPEGETLQAPNSPWWGDRVAFTVRRTADDPAVVWFVAGASGARECGRFPIAGGKDETWKSASRIAVTTNAAAYRVTMDIPLVDAFGKIPSPGDVYGVNFQRFGRTAGGPSAWAVNGGSYNTEKQVFGALVVGGSESYFRRRLAAAETRGRELASGAEAAAAVERLLGPVRRAVAERGGDAKAFGSIERMFGQLERAFVAVAQKGEALLLFEPEDAWGNAIDPTPASRPLEGVKIRTARNTRVVRAFALANLGGAPFVGCLKAFDRDWWYFQYQNSDGWGKKDGLLKHTRIRRGVPIYSRERRVLYDPLVDLPVGSLVEVAPGATVPLYLELDTHGLKSGTHKGWLKLQSCAPGFPDRKIPYEVTVTDDDLDAFDTWRLGYTHFGMTCRPNYEPATNAVRELVRRGYNTVLLSRLDIYPTRDAKGVWHAAKCELADRYIDLWLAAGLDPKKLRFLVYFGVERDHSDMWWGLRDEKQVRLPFGSPEYDEGLRFMVKSLTDHFRARYGVGLDRILWYPVDEAEGKFPDPALKSSAARCVHAARVIKSVDPANRIYSDPMWGFFVSKDFLAAKEDFVRYLDVIEPSRPQLTAKTVANLKAAGAKELWSYHVSEREYAAVNYRLHAWENMRDGMRPITTYWHLDECSGFSFKSKHAYASTYVDLDYDLLSISRRQLAADMSYEDGKLVDCLKAKFRDDPEKLARIDALVREGADGRTMKAMDRARDALTAMLSEEGSVAALRKELRAFYPPGYCRLACQAPEQTNSVAVIRCELEAWCKAHPDYDALDVRRESYLAMRRHFVPFLFKESPFYFEAGVNGGWSGARPARIVNALCHRFYKEKNLVPDAAFELLRNRQRENLTLCCGPFVDDMHHVPPMRRVLEKGFKGIREEVAEALAKCPKDDPLGRKELETALVGLDTIHELQLAFAKKAGAMLAQSDNLTARQSNNLRRIAESAQRCPWEPPRTFYEGLNTLWFVREIVGYVDGVNIFALGHPDSWFIDLYRREIAAGTLTEAEARDLVSRFLVIADCHEADSKPLDSYDDQEAEIPLTLGGCDRNGKPVYNELTKMFLDRHLACDCVYPKLHVRVGTNSPKAYLNHLGDLLCKGHAVFTVFNDDRLVKQFVDEGFAPEDARDYIGCGCWNGYVDSMQDVDGANYVSILKVLACTIHRDAELERRCGLELEPIDDVKSFEELRETVYGNYVRFLRSLMREYTRYGRSGAQIFPHPVYTMCMVGGTASRRDTTDGGLAGRQRPRELTLGFIGNVVDSLLAIDKVCFRDKVCSVREFLDAVRANWQGERNQKLRQLAMAAPYWGDNSDASVDLMSYFMRRTYEDVRDVKTDQGGAYRLAIFTYREFMYWGARTKATPDGRYDGDRLAQGFSPSEFRCKEGVTSVMNAIGRLPNECLYECNANLTFDRDAMTPELMGDILYVFAQKGSHLMQPNCNSVEQLLDAQKHPERHRDLIVRVCGFSARFVSLSKRWQDEVIARHRLK